MFASADPFSCAKVLIFVALFTWSATSAVTAGSMLPEGTPTSYASDAMNAADVLGSRQRFLKSTDEEVTASNHVVEERTPLGGIINGKALDYFVTTFRAKYRATIDAESSVLRSSANNVNFFKKPVLSPVGLLRQIKIWKFP